MRIAVVLLLCLAVAGCIYFEAQELRLTGHLDGLPLDDSWIHLQFASSLALGDGLSFRNAEWVGGSTGPLWTAALSLAFLLPGSEVLWAKFFGLLCFLGTVVGTVALARVYGSSRRFAVFAGLRFPSRASASR